MTQTFKATVRRSYPLKEQRVLVLESYEGDVEAGEWIVITLASGADERVQVASLAWGSAFHAESPPLTLVVDGLADKDPGAGASIVGDPRG